MATTPASGESTSSTMVPVDLRPDPMSASSTKPPPHVLVRMYDQGFVEDGSGERPDHHQPTSPKLLVRTCFRFSLVRVANPSHRTSRAKDARWTEVHASPRPEPGATTPSATPIG